MTDSFFNVPKEKLDRVAQPGLIQASGQRLYYRLAFRGLVYQSIID